MVRRAGRQTAQTQPPAGGYPPGPKLVFWRGQTGQIHCIFDNICHRGASLSKGVLKEDRVACPFHGFEYDAAGKVVRIPANGKNTPVPERFKVNAYPAREA
jgi:phenylpropionate dioxygenase-like ring-hydroxylating dioxygenase large terminal subunit